MTQLASRQANLGTETAFETLAEAKKLERQGKSIIHLEIGEPDFDTPEHIRDAAKQALDDGFTHYGASAGQLELREAIANHQTERQGYEVSPDSVIVTPGGKPVMFFTIMALVEEGDEVIYPNPGFPIYESMIKYTGATAVSYNLTEKKDLSIDADKVLSLINEKTRLIILNNPHNPTGSFTEKKIIDKLVEGLMNFPDVAILSDEIYDRLIFDKKEIPTMLNYPKFYDRLIVLNGWSKTYAMTGWRLGWGVWPKQLIEHVFKFCVNSHSCVNTAAQYGAIAALDGPEDHLNDMMSEFIIRRKLIVDGLRSLKGVKCSLPGGSFFVFPNVKETGMNGEEFTEKCLKEAGVAVIPGTAFGKFATNNVRFNFATSRENISRAIEKLDKIL